MIHDYSAVVNSQNEEIKANFGINGDMTLRGFGKERVQSAIGLHSFFAFTEIENAYVLTHILRLGSRLLPDTVPDS